MALKLSGIPNLFERGLDFDNKGKARIISDIEEAARQEFIIARNGHEETAVRTTLYTVPVGKILFVTSGYASVFIDNPATKAYVALEADVEGTRREILIVNAGETIDGASGNGNIDFTRALKVVAGGKVYIMNYSNDCESWAGFTGWLEDV